MRNKLTKHEEGPSSGWAKWRASRDRKLVKPRRNKAAQQLTNASGAPDHAGTSGVKGSGDEEKNSGPAPSADSQRT